MIYPTNKSIYHPPYNEFAKCICQNFKKNEFFRIKESTKRCGGDHPTNKKYLLDMVDKEICGPNKKLRRECAEYWFYVDPPEDNPTELDAEPQECLVEPPVRPIIYPQKYMPILERGVREHYEKELPGENISSMVDLIKLKKEDMLEYKC